MAFNEACAACKGACCTSLVLALPADPEVRVWLELRGRKEGRDEVRIPAPCTMLDSGVCSIYETRPEPCVAFKVGSPACIASIRANRGNDTARLIHLARKNQTGE